jgi:uncharacterized membrane protein YeaQ/YmgE (transglycosylase-associated protein family)
MGPAACPQLRHSAYGVARHALYGRSADTGGITAHVEPYEEAAMGWLWAIIVGFVLGLIAKAILPGKQHMPLWLTTILGIGGAVLGNWIAMGLGIAETSGIDWGRHLLQIAAAVVLVFLGEMAYNAARGSRQRA